MVFDSNFWVFCYISNLFSSLSYIEKKEAERKKTIEPLKEQQKPELQIDFNENDESSFIESTNFDRRPTARNLLKSMVNDIYEKNPNEEFWRLCRISIHNSSKTTIENVEVRLTNIDICPDELRGKLPLNLRFMHDKKPYKHSISINPGFRQFVDVIVWYCNMQELNPKFIICSIEQNVNTTIYDNDDYKIKIEVTGKDVIGDSKWFNVGLKKKDKTGGKIWMWPV